VQKVVSRPSADYFVVGRRQKPTQNRAKSAVFGWKT
jgi:hypothetical protein